MKTMEKMRCTLTEALVMVFSWWLKTRNHQTTFNTDRSLLKVANKKSSAGQFILTNYDIKLPNIINIKTT